LAWCSAPFTLHTHKISQKMNHTDIYTHTVSIVFLLRSGWCSFESNNSVKSPKTCSNTIENFVWIFERAHNVSQKYVWMKIKNVVKTDKNWTLFFFSS
jgi:hypothetical protein